MAVPATAVPALELSATRTELADLYSRHAPEVLRFALLLVGDRDLAEDLLQESFVRVASRPRTLRRPDALPAYLKRAVANLVVSQYRHERVVRRWAVVTHRRDEAVIDPDVAAHDDLWEALAKLPPRRRAALVLRFYEDLTVQQIAGVLDCRPGTVKSLISRGLDQMREELSDA